MARVLHLWVSLLCVQMRGCVGGLSRFPARASDLDCNFCLWHLAAPFKRKRLLEALSLGCVGDLRANHMLAASDPVISKRIVCGPGCSQGARIIYFQENEGEQARSNSFPDP